MYSLTETKVKYITKKNKYAKDKEAKHLQATLRKFSYHAKNNNIPQKHTFLQEIILAEYFLLYIC